jgi:hypothetical protein
MRPLPIVPDASCVASPETAGKLIMLSKPVASGSVGMAGGMAVAAERGPTIIRFYTVTVPLLIVSGPMRRVMERLDGKP